VWVELFTPSYYSSPASVSFYALAYGEDSPVILITYYYENNVIGTSTPGDLFTWENVQAGEYTLTAVATDKYQQSRPSSPVQVTVYGPIIPYLFPANNSVVSSTFQVNMTADKIGPNDISTFSVICTSSNGTVFQFAANVSSNFTGYTSPSLSFATGSATLVIKMTDISGAYTQQTTLFTVSSTAVPLIPISHISPTTTPLRKCTPDNKILCININ